MRKMVCDACNKEFLYKYQSKVKRRFCSQICHSLFITCNPTIWKNLTSNEKLESLKESYNKFVVKKEGCWDWTGYKSQGRSFIQKSKRIKFYSNRVSWELHFGKIPLGINVLHKCDNGICSNPDHLFLGTQLDNSRDCALKKRVFRQKLSKDEVIKIRDLLKTNLPNKIIAIMFKISPSTICDIKYNRSWSYI